MLNMSFALTTPQILAREKHVTRRLGWLRLKQNDCLSPVKKCMGLRPGEKIERLRGPLQVVSTRREPLNRMLQDLKYGKEECRKEGFPDMSPEEFVAFFCASHKGCQPDTLLTRIEFDYTD